MAKKPKEVEGAEIGNKKAGGKSSGKKSAPAPQGAKIGTMGK